MQTPAQPVGESVCSVPSGGSDDFETEVMAERLGRYEMIDYDYPKPVAPQDGSRIRKGGHVPTAVSVNGCERNYPVAAMHKTHAGWMYLSREYIRSAVEPGDPHRSWTMTLLVVCVPRIFPFPHCRPQSDEDSDFE